MAHKSEDERITELEDQFVRLEERLTKLGRAVAVSPVEQRASGSVPVRSAGGFYASPFVREVEGDGGEVTLGHCEWETIHNDPRTSIKVHLKLGSAEMEVNDGDPAPLSRCNWIRASGKVRVHGTGGEGRRAQIEWKPV